MTTTSTDWKCPSCQAAGTVDRVPHEPWCALFMQSLERDPADDQLTVEGALEQEEETKMKTTDMTAEQLVYRLVSSIGFDEFEELRNLEGKLYDAGSSAHDAARQWSEHGSYFEEFTSNAATLRDLAGYVGRVADACESRLKLSAGSEDYRTKIGHNPIGFIDERMPG